MIILGIETSCDETAISIVKSEGDIQNPHFEVLGSALISQIKLHEQYGGVYPTLAKREHIRNLPIVLSEALNKAKLEINAIDLIAVTVGPGLEPALWTGITFAENLAKENNIPLIPTNHMEGHIASVLLSGKKVEFPAIALLISGGHTELVHLKNWNEKEIIGETKDDAVGEAYDKVARMLGAPYPGGPEISRMANESEVKGKVEPAIKLPRPMIQSGDMNFSFSGLKTAVLYLIKSINKTNGELSLETKNAIAREFQNSVIDVLISKSKQAIKIHHPNTFIIGGGVIANTKIREAFSKLIDEMPNLNLMIPEREFTTDNATMIAVAAYLTHLNHKDNSIPLKADGNLKYIS